LEGSFRVGEWVIEPQLNSVSAAGNTIRLEPKVMQVLVCLADKAGDLVTKEELIRSAWPDTFITDEVLTRAIFELRRVFGDDAKNPRFIQTIPKSGYRLIAEVCSAGKKPPEEPESTTGLSNAATVVQARVRRRTGAVLGAVSIPALLIFGLVWFHNSAAPPASSLPPLKALPFTSYPGEEYMGALSPDGNQIAFGWNGEKGMKEMNSSIYVKQVGSEKPLRLTFSPANDFGPVWSPDGQRIAFIRITDDISIFSVPALGGPERKLLTMGPNMPFSGLLTLAWSPDGKWIAFTYKAPKEEPAKIFLVSPDTFTVHTLTSPPAHHGGDFNPAFSPDGRSVAFVRKASLQSGDIYTVPTRGGEPRRLTFDNTFLAGLTWTADGSEIVFSSTRAGGDRLSLWKIPASGGAEERVAVEGFNLFFPNISRHGNRLTYVQALGEDANIYRIDVPEATVSKNPPTRLIASTRYDGGPEFSPDGKKIAFHSDRSGELEIWMCDADGTNLAQVTSIRKKSGLPALVSRRSANRFRCL